jgi:hypothetical protein
MEGYDYNKMTSLDQLKAINVDITDLNSFNGKDLARSKKYHTSLVPYIWCSNTYYESRVCPAECVFDDEQRTCSGSYCFIYQLNDSCPEGCVIYFIAFIIVVIIVV